MIDTRRYNLTDFSSRSFSGTGGTATNSTKAKKVQAGTKRIFERFAQKNHSHYFQLHSHFPGSE